MGAMRCALTVALGRPLALILALAAVTAALRPAVAGHGGVVQLRAVSAGPYTVSAWTQPVPPRPGPWRIDVAVMAETGTPIVDAVVRITAEAMDAPSRRIEAEARRDADPLGVRHRVDLELDRAGAWQVTISIGGSRGAGAVSFPVDVEPAARGWWAVAGTAGLGVAGLGWLLLRRRRGRAPAAGAPARGKSLG
jgi:hypothetical protein